MLDAILVSAAQVGSKSVNIDLIDLTRMGIVIDF